MNIVVDTVVNERVVHIEEPRVTLTLDEDEATTLKLALEYLRSPLNWGEEAVALREYDHGAELDRVIGFLEQAQVFVDGVYV